MKLYKYRNDDRENLIVIDKVVMVHMSNTTGWITLQGRDGVLSVNRWVAEGLIKAMEETSGE
tara:strand:+ start:238 stop:423 length:186 start_codon:yes stop_codon:yes gene_type:complete